MPAEPCRIRTLTEYAELMDARAARTRNLCTEHPDQHEVRTALLRAEKEIHHDGWDGVPKVFVLHQNTQTHRIRYTEVEDLSRMLTELPGRPTDVLDQLADLTEFVRRHAQVPAAGLGRAIYERSSSFRRMVLRVRANPDADLIDGTGSHWRFHGVGMVCEGWMVLNTDDTIEQQARDHKLHANPERMEVREVYYAARDGWTWEVMRVRRTPTIALPRHCIVLHREDDYRLIGSVPHALTRMCNAIASNPVPIVPADTPSDD